MGGREGRELAPDDPARVPTAAESSALRAHRNLVFDWMTVRAMVRIYCHDQHHRFKIDGLCQECAALADYARERLARCPFGPEKTTCRECRIHCYRAAERAAMKDVMRYAGPRMLWRHPILALRHAWLDRVGPPPWPPYARRMSAKH